MKNIKTKIPLLTAAVTIALAGWTATAVGAETKTNSVPERIGVYDSRVVAYACFWSEAHQRKLNETTAAARDAKAAGDTARFNELAAALRKQQEQLHLQVFSTAPADDALAEIKDRLPTIQKEARVSTLISKWDETALKQHVGAEQVDVTDALAREFKPGEKQLKTIEEIKKQKPVPLEDMKKMKD